MMHETKVGIVVACSFLGLVGVVLTLKMKEGSNPPAAAEAEVPAWGEPTPISPADATAQTVVSPPASIPGPPAVVPPPVSPTSPPQPLHDEILRTSGRDEARPGATTGGAGTGSAVPPPSGIGGDRAPDDHHELVGPPPPAGGALADASPSATEPRPPTASEPVPGATAPRDPAVPARDEAPVPSSARAEDSPREGAPIVMPPPPGTAETAPSAPASSGTAAVAPPSPSGTGLPGPGTTGASVPGSGTPTAGPPGAAAPSVTIGPPDGGRAPGSQPGVMPVHPAPTAPAADTMPEVRPEAAGQVLSPTAVAAAQTGGLPPLGAPAAVATPAITPPVPLPGAPKVQSYDEEIYQWKPGDSFAAVAQQYYHNPKYEKALLMFNRDHPMGAKGLVADPPVPQVNEMVFIPPAKILESRYGSAIPDLSPLPAPGSPVVPATAVTPSTPVAPLPVAAAPGAVAPNASSSVAPPPVTPIPGAGVPGATAVMPSSPVAPPPVTPVPGAGSVTPSSPVAPPPVTPIPGAGSVTPGSPVAPPPVTPIPGAGSVTPSGAVPPVTPIPGAVTPPLSAPLPGAIPVTANATPRNYQVQGQDGEMMYRIAEQQLGNGNRWMEIRDLNPTWRPEQPVPAGTVLRLPAQ